jgi:hypothetical protein
MSGVLSRFRSGRRRSTFVAVVALLAFVLAACGGGGSASDAPAGPDTTLFGSGPESSQVTAGQDASSPTSTSGEASAETPTPSSATDQDLPDAPDFTLELGEGGEFVLSAEPKPVYLIFWAEW